MTALDATMLKAAMAAAKELLRVSPVAAKKTIKLLANQLADLDHYPCDGCGDYVPDDALNLVYWQNEYPPEDNRHEEGYEHVCAACLANPPEKEDR